MLNQLETIIEEDKYPRDLEIKEEELGEIDDFNETPPTDIIAFNELRSCADLVRMYKNQQLDIKPDFQRDLVWSKTSQTLFIDSLVKQLPIPSMCISLDYKTGKRLVIDGLQRMSSIISFLSDDTWTLSSLTDIDERISGKTVKSIRDKHEEIYNRVENLTIPITVLRCDYAKKKHMQYLFTIFHRLNTGGNKLNNQEIRNCIFQGNFNNLLKRLARTSEFCKFLNLEKNKSYRLIYEELILRAFAMESDYQHYNGRLAQFLNNFMNEHQNDDENTLNEKESRFLDAIDLIFTHILDRKPLPKISKATTEAILVGVLRNLDTLQNLGDIELQSRFNRLRQHENFSLENLKSGLSHKDNVINRLETAIEIFS
ncbi:DUF262 domain-containing protein [Pseudanabaena biceps]|nr:DUF262 domain-containing protein [Pseudanabaena biceps]